MSENTFSKIVGHKEQIQNLRKLVANDKLSHSNLFAGPSGVGKKLIARQTAKLLLCESPSGGSACENCESCKLVDSGNHPDFYPIECNSSDFKAEEARELLYNINLTPYRRHKRVIIFNDADSLSAVVGNLLLKTLEEPRKDSYFFLIASNPSRLPIPLVSRCQIWRFSRLSKAEIKEALKEQLSKEQIDDLAQIANGSLEHIKDLESFLPIWSETKNILDSILAGDSYKALNYASQIAKNKEQISNQLGLIRIYLRSKIFAETNPDKQLQIADSLENIISAERLILERNLAPLAVLNMSMLTISGKLPSNARSLEDLVV